MRIKAKIAPTKNSGKIYITNEFLIKAQRYEK
jgi:hypothetical protein